MDFIFQILDRGNIAVLSHPSIDYRHGSPEGYIKLSKDINENHKWIEVLEYWADKYPEVVLKESKKLWDKRRKDML